MQFSPYGGNGTVFAPSDVVEYPANFEDKAENKSKPNEVGSIWKGGARERRRRIQQL